ncbi:DUF2187 family protein, partial [Bacillus cereus]|nr:DUF2187 family protein [Bacillus cereus]
IVDITIMKNFRELDMEPLTVVSHKNYTVINQNA